MVPATKWKVMPETAKGRVEVGRKHRGEGVGASATEPIGTEEASGDVVAMLAYDILDTEST